MRYVALLRGINVGGKNKVDMKSLKAAFEKAGMKDVVTYINSGNIIFSSAKSKQKLKKTLEKVILDTFGLSIKVLLLTFLEMKAVVEKIPKGWVNDAEMKSDVLFLWNEGIGLEAVGATGIDTVKYYPNFILWNVKKKDLLKSGQVKLPAKKVYQQITIRNVNTTRNIYELMQ